MANFRRSRNAPRRRPSKEDQDRGPSVLFHPRYARQLVPILRQIGLPEPEPFRPDPFQLESLACLDDGDVVVSAPTGSGKTYIAAEAMARILAGGGRSWYASPLKALSNSKFLEFGKHFGPENVGLLTGDHKVNPDAPIIVGTTEILRNQLYDAMHCGENLQADLVVMDEAHYLGDPDRGVVWEEVIIYLASRVRLLLLSATVANAREIADWLTTIRRQPATAVITHQRPVPLHPLFIMPDGELLSLTRNRSLNPQIRHYLEQQGRQDRNKIRITLGRTFRVLGEFNLLPAIFFLKSRSDCDLALSRSYGATAFSSPELKRRRNARLDELLEQYPFLGDHPHLKYVRGPGVASHHAGHLPHWKMVVEQLMQDGLLTAIFSTSTVAAGVNFPARTVVIHHSDRFNGREFADLTTTDLLQMTGRAGRRGKDNIGFALVVPGPYQNPGLIEALFKAPPEPVLSQIRINFSMTLNLLLSHTPEQIQPLLDQSLAAFQQVKSPEGREAASTMERLSPMISKGQCTGPEQALVLYQTHRRLTRESDRIRRSRPRIAWEATLRQGLTAGRLFIASTGQTYCALEPAEKRGIRGILAAKVDEHIGAKKGRIREKFVAADKVAALLDGCLAIGPETETAEAIRLVRDAANREYPALDHEAFARTARDEELDALDRRAEVIQAELGSLACAGCAVLDTVCHGDPRGEAAALLYRLERLEADFRQSGGLLWSSFLRHLDFLKSEGFVSSQGELTADGAWASQLRLDHPLIIAAGLKTGVWPDHDPALLAAVVAPFVVDREMEPEDRLLKLPPDLKNAWLKLETGLAPMIRRQAEAGFPTPFLYLKPALAIYAWAQTEDFDEAVRLYGQDPGDMAMLVFRAADNLRQLGSLREKFPRLADCARQAVDMILKEPVIIPL